MASPPIGSFVETVPVGNGAGLPALNKALPWTNQFSDQSIKGALKVNPAYAADFVSGRFLVQFPRNNQINAPLETESKPVAQKQATSQGPNAWKKKTLPAGSNQVKFGYGAKPQKLFAANAPWNKAFIPPLALFNDASQWVNRLMFHPPMQRSGNGSSDPDLKAQYFTPPPIIVNNLAAGTLNAQLQLGTIAIQAQQLSIAASNYFGGS
jgi:hypothetical protein